MGVALITCTRDRAEAFALCSKYVSAQAPGFDWIVVDDGDAPIGLHISPLSHYVRREPSTKRNTLPENLLAGLRVAQDQGADTIALVEDDEWYSPQYVEIMLEKIKGFEVAGQIGARYYNVADRRWMQANNTTYASLCRTVVRGERAIGRLHAAATAALQAESPFVDQWLWGLRGAPAEVLAGHGLAENLFRDDGLSVGIKGMPGRGGLGRAHGREAMPNKDPQMLELRRWIGADALAYEGFYREEKGTGRNSSWRKSQ